ncbi:YcaO-like family protein [Corynebacterium parakroppenstedtii]|uniref:YcaO-like family protein n=1 Tax=Corynebacterium parakroppenstedtii TaxID=2828363 RepID=UPI001C8F97B8|nr:YcaO-like family protein [Corynebacterium parakroppenstedtii]MBY0793730.1 YcaO-like family protein [Corynebacterium parakroppenstedtii]
MSIPARIKSDVKWSDRKASNRALHELGSSYIGVAPVSYAITYEPGELPSTYIGIECCEAQLTLGYPANRNNGGANLEAESSFLAGVAETIERYSAAYAMMSDLQADPRLPALLPAGGRPFSREQYERQGFGYAPYDEETMLWTTAYDPLTETEVRVPSSAVFLREFSAQPKAHDYHTSNGLAAGPSLEEAFLSGLLELIERDGVMRAWESRWSPPKINMYSGPRVRNFVEEYASRSALEYTALDLTPLTGVPTVLGIVIDSRGGESMMGTGAKASWDPEQATIGALTEAFHCVGYSKNILRTRGRMPEDARLARQNVRDLEDHVRFYASSEAVKRSSWLLSCTKTSDLSEMGSIEAPTPGQAVLNLLEILAEQGVRCAGVDVTSPDIAETPLRVVRVISDELVPLTVGYGNAHLGYSRLASMFSASSGSPSINPDPHPFP